VEVRPHSAYNNGEEMSETKDFLTRPAAEYREKVNISTAALLENASQGMGPKKKIRTR
jgi:hypothetical protein